MERFITTYVAFYIRVTHTQTYTLALMVEGVMGRPPYTVNLFPLFELYIRCISYLSKGFI